MPSQRIEAEPGRYPIISTHEDSNGGEYVFQDRLCMLHMAAVFHPQLGESTAPYDGYLREHAGTHQTAGHGQGMHWTTAKAFDIYTSGSLATAHLRNCLGEV